MTTKSKVTPIHPRDVRVGDDVAIWPSGEPRMRVLAVPADPRASAAPDGPCEVRTFRCAEGYVSVRTRGDAMIDALWRVTP
jgi:hypothetical protein